MSAGHDRKANTWGGGALEDVDLCLAQHLGELDGPFRTDVVVAETAKDARVGKVREQACHGAMTERRTLRHRFEYQAAHDSEVRAELPWRPFARAAPPFAPSWLL